MLLSIVIVSWNTRDLLEKCLDSVYSYPCTGDFEIWLVDNASGDDSVQMVREKFPAVKLIENCTNPGFASGNNQAIKLCAGKYIMLLNPDTEIKPGSLDILTNFMEKNATAGGAGPRLLFPDGTLQQSCHPTLTLSRELWRLYHLDKLYSYGTYDMDKWDIRKPRVVEVLQGAALILRKQALDQVGILDEGYFMYTEEVDLCYRLRKAGWLMYWVPEAAVLHYGGQSTRLVPEKMFLTLYQSRIRFFRKHYGNYTAAAYKMVLMAAALTRIILMPISILIRPTNRERNVTLANHYRRLVANLSTM